MRAGRRRAARRGAVGRNAERVTYRPAWNAPLLVAETSARRARGGTASRARRVLCVRGERVGHRPMAPGPPHLDDTRGTETARAHLTD